MVLPFQQQFFILNLFLDFQTYTGCGCIQPTNSAPPIDIAESGTCGFLCNMLIPYIVIFCISSSIGSLSRAPSAIVMFRSVRHSTLCNQVQLQGHISYIRRITHIRHLSYMIIIVYMTNAIYTSNNLFAHCFGCMMICDWVNRLTNLPIEYPLPELSADTK